MRLYCIIPNYVFFEKIAKNPEKIGCIECDDLEGTEIINFTYDSLMPHALNYLDKKEWMGNSICTFTTPAECKMYLNANSVMFSFEKNNNEYVSINANVLYKCLEAEIEYEKRLSRINFIEKFNYEDYTRRAEEFAKFQENQLSALCKTDSYYDTFIVVPDIEISSIKSFFVLPNNKQIDDIKKVKNINLIVENKSKELGE